MTTGKLIYTMRYSTNIHQWMINCSQEWMLWQFVLGMVSQDELTQRPAWCKGIPSLISVVSLCSGAYGQHEQSVQVLMTNFSQSDSFLASGTIHIFEITWLGSALTFSVRCRRMFCFLSQGCAHIGVIKWIIALMGFNLTLSLNWVIAPVWML